MTSMTMCSILIFVAEDLKSLLSYKTYSLKIKNKIIFPQSTDFKINSLTF